MLSGNPLSDLMLTQICFAQWRHMSRNDMCASTNASITALLSTFTILIIATLSAKYISEMFVHSMDHYVLPILKQTLHATHLLKLFDKMCKFEKDLMSIVEDTERTRFCQQTDRRTRWNQNTPPPPPPPFQLRWGGGYNKKFREWQHPRPAELRKWKHWLSVAITNGNPLHGTLHHATEFQAVMCFPHMS